MNDLNVVSHKLGESMSSLEIAEVTGKEHKNVMRDIQNLLSQGVDKLNFERISYKDSMNRVRDAYQLTYKGVLILASGYNPVLREKIINRWEELETGKEEPKYAQQSPSQSKLSDKIQAATGMHRSAIVMKLLTRRLNGLKKAIRMSAWNTQAAF